MKILAYNSQALSIDGKGVYIEDLSALAENGSLIKIVTPIVNKGDLIYLDVDGKGDKLYRVLKCKGDVAKVVAMYDTLTSVYNSTSTTTTFGSTTAQKYENSTLDTYLNTTWYNTLSTEAKNAIVPENVVQYCYQYYDEPNTPNTPTYTYQYQYDWSDSDYENANDVGNVTVGDRNVFALDLKDIFNYFDKVCITSDELMTLFWNSTAKVSKYLWLRSSLASNSNYAWYVYDNYGYLGSNLVDNSYVVRPAFNINLSQIPFTVYDPYPKKGDIVKMNLDGTERQYRVLSVNGNVCKVLGMWDDFTSVYNSTSTTTTFGSTTAQKYEGSTLDTYLNTTWYNTLSSEAKNAIVPENVVQYCYQYYDEPNTPNTPTYTYQYQYNWSDSDYENANDVGNVTVGDRNVFALDLKDIFDYFGKVCITSNELMTMFWNSTAKVSKHLWLRSSRADYSSYAWLVGGNSGNLGRNGVTNGYVVRPALNLDFSKISFTIT